MNALRQSSTDESDDALDRAIRAITAQSAPSDVKNRALETAIAFTPHPRQRFQFLRRRSWRIAASAAATIVVASLLAFLMLPSASVGWADVVKAMRSQRWIRATGDHKRDKHEWKSTMWLSPELQVWAFHETDDYFLFFDGRRKEKYEYRAGDKQIVKMLLGGDDAQRFSPVDYASQGSWVFGTEKLIAKNRHEVTEGGKKWIDFDIVFFRGDDDLSTMRVDPETRLPVYLLARYSKDPTSYFKFTFDYPSDGPADIYALGVPAKIAIDDRMPADDCLRVLRGMAASRAKIGDFRLEVVVDPPYHGVSSIVWRKGDRWRIDTCQSGTILPQDKHKAKPPDGLGWRDPFAVKLRLYWAGPNFLCDGRMVYRNAQRMSRDAAAVVWEVAPAHTTPQELLSGEGLGTMDLAPYAKIASLLYPDLSSRAGWGFEFDPQPADAPGCVLIKRSAQTSREDHATAHEWYYIDPAKGCAVVRVEVFTLSANVPADPKASSCRQSIRMEDFRQSPQGFWYPESICDSMPVARGPNQKDGSTIQRLTTTVHYHFDFDVTLPDSLFVVDGASKSNE